MAFLCYLVSTGIYFYAFGLFLGPLVAEEGWSRAGVGAAYSLAQVMSAVYAPSVGRLVDRRGPRFVQLLGAATLAAGLAMLGCARGVVAFDLVMGLVMALGAVCLGGLTSNAAIASWFSAGRGRALGIATAGISMGGVVFVPLTHACIERLGWRGAFWVLAATVLVLLVPAIALLMDRPGEHVAASARLDPAELAALEAELRASLTLDEAIAHRNFGLLVVALSISGAALSVVLLHQIGFFTDRGLGERLASWSLGATAGVGVLGKLGFGWLLDRHDQRRVAGLCFLLQSAGVGLMLATRSPGMLWVFVLVYGFAMGGNATLQATLVADCFGRAHYGAIFGRLLAFCVAVQAVAVPLAGWVRDRTGRYEVVFAALGLATLASAAAAQGLTFLRLADDSPVGSDPSPGG